MDEEIVLPLLAMREGVRVVDVDGLVMGRVARVDVPALAFDVRLRARVAERFGAHGDVVRLPAADIIDADDHEVTVNEEAAFLLRPEARPDPHSSSF